MKMFTIYTASSTAHENRVQLFVPNMKAAIKLARGIFRQRGLAEPLVDRYYQTRPSGRVEFHTPYDAKDWVEIVIRNPVK